MLSNFSSRAQSRKQMSPEALCNFMLSVQLRPSRAGFSWATGTRLASLLRAGLHAPCARCSHACVRHTAPQLVTRCAGEVHYNLLDSLLALSAVFSVAEQMLLDCHCHPARSLTLYQFIPFAPASPMILLPRVPCSTCTSRSARSAIGSASRLRPSTR